MAVITIKYFKTQFVHLKDIVHLCLLLVVNAILYNKKINANLGLGGLVQLII